MLNVMELQVLQSGGFLGEDYSIFVNFFVNCHSLLNPVCSVPTDVQITHWFTLTLNWACCEVTLFRNIFSLLALSRFMDVGHQTY